MCRTHSLGGLSQPAKAAASQPLLSCLSGSRADISAGLEAEDEEGAKAGGSRERARGQQLWRAGWKVRGHRGMRGHKGPEPLCDRPEEWVIKNI